MKISTTLLVLTGSLTGSRVDAVVESTTNNNGSLDGADTEADSSPRFDPKSSLRGNGQRLETVPGKPGQFGLRPKNVEKGKGSPMGAVSLRPGGGKPSLWSLTGGNKSHGLNSAVSTPSTTAVTPILPSAMGSGRSDSSGASSGGQSSRKGDAFPGALQLPVATQDGRQDGLPVVAAHVADAATDGASSVHSDGERNGPASSNGSPFRVSAADLTITDGQHVDAVSAVAAAGAVGAGTASGMAQNATTPRANVKESQPSESVIARAEKESIATEARALTEKVARDAGITTSGTGRPSVPLLLQHLNKGGGELNAATADDTASVVSHGGISHGGASQGGVSAALSQGGASSQGRERFIPPALRDLADALEASNQKRIPGGSRPEHMRIMNQHQQAMGFHGGLNGGFMPSFDAGPQGSMSANSITQEGDLTMDERMQRAVETVDLSPAERIRQATANKAARQGQAVTVINNGQTLEVPANIMYQQNQWYLYKNEEKNRLEEWFFQPYSYQQPAPQLPQGWLVKRGIGQNARMYQWQEWQVSDGADGFVTQGDFVMIMDPSSYGVPAACPPTTPFYGNQEEAEILLQEMSEGKVRGFEHKQHSQEHAVAGQAGLPSPGQAGLANADVQHHVGQAGNPQQQSYLQPQGAAQDAQPYLRQPESYQGGGVAQWGGLQEGDAYQSEALPTPFPQRDHMGVRELPRMPAASSDQAPQPLQTPPSQEAQQMAQMVAIMPAGPAPGSNMMVGVEGGQGKKKKGTRRTKATKISKQEAEAMLRLQGCSEEQIRQMMSMQQPGMQQGCVPAEGEGQQMQAGMVPIQQQAQQQMQAGMVPIQHQAQQQMQAGMVPIQHQAQQQVQVGMQGDMSGMLQNMGGSVGGVPQQQSGINVLHSVLQAMQGFAPVIMPLAPVNPPLPSATMVFTQVPSAMCFPERQPLSPQQVQEIPAPWVNSQGGGMPGSAYCMQGQQQQDFRGGMQGQHGQGQQGHGPQGHGTQGWGELPNGHQDMPHPVWGQAYQEYIQQQQSQQQRSAADQDQVGQQHQGWRPFGGVQGW